MSGRSMLEFAHPGFVGRIGAAREDITPPVGIYARNWGAALTDVAEGVHKPLTATALTIQSEDSPSLLVLVSLDLGWWRSSRDERSVRDAVLSALQLGEERLLLHFTHTHASPVLCREDFGKPGGELIGPYLESLTASIIRGIRTAIESAETTLLEWSYGRCDLAANRDLPDPEAPRYLSGFNPDGSADDTVLVGRATALDGRCVATIVNYACHPTTLAWQNNLLSPDFVGAMRDVVEAETTPGPCLFLQGASGELAPRTQYTGDTEVADTHGRRLGYAVLSTLNGMLPFGTCLGYTCAVESGAPLAQWNTRPAHNSKTIGAAIAQVDMTLQKLPTVDELTAAIGEQTERVSLERLVRKRRIREAVGDGISTKMPAWIWVIGDAILAAHPNEAYSLLQRELRARFPNRAIAVLNVTNGHFGYLPPAELYAEDMYPVWQTPFAAGSLEKLIKCCTETIDASITNE